MSFGTKVCQFSSGFGTVVAAGSFLNLFKSKSVPNNEGTETTPPKRQIQVEGYSLKMVQILVRHGARTPLHTIKNVEEVTYEKSILASVVPHTVYSYDPVDLNGGPRPFSTYDFSYSNKVLRGGSGYGVLTTTGQEQCYMLGLNLRKQYIQEAQFLEDSYNPDHIYVRSTNTNRTVDTARCVIAGMFGHRQLDKLQEPPKIHVEVFHSDPLVPRTGVCRVLRQINHAAMIHGSDMQDLREDRLVIEGLLGIPRNAKKKINFIDIRDDLIARETHGFSIPQVLVPHKQMVVQNATKLMFYAFCGQHEAERGVATRLSAGPLVTMLLDNIENMDTNKTKMYLFACHDSTLVALLGALELFDNEWPPFTADIRFEVYENDSKQRFIRVSYNGQDRIIKGASGELCPLEDFRQTVSPLLINDQEYKELCSSDILVQIAKEMLEAEQGEEEDSEDKERSDTPAGM